MIKTEITAAILIIGDEILSGRTQDVNINFIAKELSELGIHLSEVRVIPDIKERIINTINELRQKYTYIFTTGGIGPTHDDITTESIAKAFNVPVALNKYAEDIMREYYRRKHNREINEASLKMAYIPVGAELIQNNISSAPGFKIQNVYVMAGIPKIMQDMFYNIKASLKTSTKFYTKTVTSYIGESIIAKILTDIQNNYSEITVGSYPFETLDGWRTDIVFRGQNIKIIDKALNQLGNQLSSLGIKFEKGN
jgi:molybdenum cofactor synthesis domain-containing protein